MKGFVTIDKIDLRNLCLIVKGKIENKRQQKLESAIATLCSEPIKKTLVGRFTNKPERFPTEDEALASLKKSDGMFMGSIHYWIMEESSTWYTLCKEYFNAANIATGDILVDVEFAAYLNRNTQGEQV